MTCNRLDNLLDDYLDGALDNKVADEVSAHVESCADCEKAVARARELQGLLREYGDSSMPTPEATFYDEALVQAARAGRKQQHKRSWMTGFGSAIAAGLAIWAVAAMFMSGPTNMAPAADVPLVAMSIEEPRTVNLVFSSATSLDDATLTVLLPEGVQIAGFEGQREITWMTSLNEGKNVLPLKLIAAFPTEGELLATLKHGEDDRVFRLRVNVS